MAVISVPNTFTTGATIVASEHNSNFSTITNDYNGNITNANIAAAAAIIDSKLAQITSGGKVSGAAITLLTSIPSGAGILPGVNGGLPSGAIILWSGAISAIPTGFVICDGNNSTPDLTDRFVLHADADSGGTNDVGDSGGASTHNHGAVTGTWTIADNSQAGSNTKGAAHDHSISSDSNVPKYYALAYIMKT